VLRSVSPSGGVPAVPGMRRKLQGARPASDHDQRTRPASHHDHQRTWPAALTLFFGAGLIPETVATFNSPPLLLLTRPPVFLFISAFYGSVALLVREFLRGRNSRWASVLLLGMAAGAVNEGVIAGTWYKVQYPGYALVGGVDPAVAVGLTVFHALVSTILPILLVELIFPDMAGRRWLSRPGVLACLILLAVTTASGFAPPAHRGPKAVVLGCVLIAVLAALALPRSANRPASTRPVPGLGRLRLAGSAAAVAFFAIFAIVPGLIAVAVPAADRGPWQILPVTLMAAFFWLAVAAGRSWGSRAAWGPAQTLAVVTGVLLPAIAASLVLPAPLHNLEPLVTLPALALLVWLRWRQRHQVSAQ
jgi:hypothetical protein